MSSRYVVAVLWLTVMLSGCGAMAQGGAISRACSAIEKGKYERALARLSGAARHTAPDSARQAEINLLAGRSFEGLGDLPRATGAYLYVVRRFPASVHAFTAAERLKALGVPVAAPPPVPAVLTIA